MYTSGFLCALGLFAILQVPGTFGSDPTAGPIPLSQDDIDKILEKHNKLRASVQPPATNMLHMNWSESAAKNAQFWANQCLVEHSEPYFRVVNGTICGENIFMSSYPIEWDVVVQSWYNEVKNWKYGQGPTGPRVVGHYTQLVHYKSHQLGCAMAKCDLTSNPDYKYSYVCHYCPEGNHDLGKPYNTGRVCGECKHACRNNLCYNPCLHNDKAVNCYRFKFFCGFSLIGLYCPATCKCTNQIK